MPASTNEQKPDSAALERHAEVPSNKRQRLDDAADVPNSAWLHKFDRDLAALALKAARDLKEQGWAVVEGVLSGGDCDDYYRGLWDWLEALGTGLDRSKPDTWRNNWPPTYRGILNTLEIAHQSFVWKVRTNPRLVKIFALLLGTSELLTSFDAINLLNPEVNEAPTAGWLHVDQSPMTEGLACLQGLVNLAPVGPESSGTLMVRDKSSGAHQDFFQQHSGLSAEELAQVPDHYQFLPQHMAFWDKYDSIGLQGGAGSLFLWDSRTAHTNAYPAQLTAWRHVVYTCYQPRSMASPEDLRLKAQAWQEHQITTHLPARNVRVYDADFAKRWPNEAKVMDESIHRFKVRRDRDQHETPAMRRLAGVEAYPPEDAQQHQRLIDVPVDQLSKLLETYADPVQGRC